MFGIRAFLLGTAIGGAATYTSLNYHVVRTADGVHLVSRAVKPPINNTYVDLRNWEARDWKSAPEFQEALVRAGHADLIADGSQANRPNSLSREKSGNRTVRSRTTSFPTESDEARADSIFPLKLHSTDEESTAENNGSISGDLDDAPQTPIVFRGEDAQRPPNETPNRDRLTGAQPPLRNVSERSAAPINPTSDTPPKNSFDPFAATESKDDPEKAKPATNDLSATDGGGLSLESINDRLRRLSGSDAQAPRSSSPGSNLSQNGSNTLPKSIGPARPSLATDPRAPSPFKDFFQRFIPPTAPPAAARVEMGRPSFQPPRSLSRP